jgi:20S proteasome alpha/beta subunit
LTLIVGIKCTDGVVLAADSAATYGNLGSSTIVQNSATKLTKLGDTGLLGVSGPVGFSQRFAAHLGGLWAQPVFHTLSSTLAMENIAQQLKQVIAAELPLMQEWAKVMPGRAHLGLISLTLVAAPFDNEARLFQFDHQGSPEEATVDLPFVAIGSGSPIAEPFLAFLRRIFWPTSLPTVSLGLLSAVWTLDHAIATAPGGVGGDIHATVLERHGDLWLVRDLDTTEVQEHKQLIQNAEARLRSFQETLTPGANEAEVPSPPPADT